MYHVSMESVADRTAYIAGCPPTGLTHQVPFRGEMRQLGRVRVEDKYLIYRLDNMRTSVKQAEYVVEHNLPHAFFDKTDENPSAQQAQHEILLELSKVPTADIYSHLREDPQQDMPIIVTASGSVVDGNRRLAAMRDLYSGDPGRYSTFSYIDVAVLPDTAIDNDLVEMETIIQIRPNLQSDYGWIEEALGLEMQMDVLGWSLIKLSQLWRKSPEELQKKLEALAIARDYLSFIGKPEQYGLIEGSEQAMSTFRDSINAATFKSLAPRRKQANTLVMYAVLRSTDIGRRKYDYAKKITDITNRVISQLDPLPTTRSPEVVDPSNPLGGLPMDDTDIDETIIDLLEDPGNLEDVAEFAEEALIELDQAAKATKKGNQLLQAATFAHNKLLEVQTQNLDPATYSRSVNILLSTVAESVKLVDYVLRQDGSVEAQLDVAQVNQLRPAVSLYRHLSRDSRDRT